MKAEVIAIGTEILLGEIVDTNSAYLAGRLPGLGIGLYRITQLGDNRARLAEFLRRALADNDLVITTGGLGPTEDDVTREAVADAFAETPSVDPDLERALRAWFESRQAPMPERNVKQAWRLPSTRALPNPRGTAPGWWTEKAGQLCISLPGPPSEMRPMWEAEVEPLLAQRASGTVIVTRTLKTVGIGEGRVDEMVAPLLASENPSIGIYSRPDGIHLRLGARAADRNAAAALIAPVEARIRQILGDALWGTDEDTLPRVVLRLLAERQQTLGVVENQAAGGAVTALLCEALAPGVWRGSEVWSGSSDAVAQAHAARLRTGARVGLGVVVETEGHGSIAVVDATGVETACFRLPQALPAIRARAATTAFALLRRRYF
ncbi:MAG: competence/damage-inducible protein A [Candidatus Xenobia bacterium]